MDIKNRELLSRAVEDSKLINLGNLKTFKTKLEEKINASTSRLFKADKTTLEKADSEVIAEYFQTNSEITPRTGDIFVITTKVQEKEYEKSSYFYNVDNWEAITGHVDADKVILRKDFVGAGNWTSFGTVNKPANGTVSIKGNGISVQDFMEGLVSQKLQPTTITQPSVSGFALTGAKAVEVGTKVETATFGTAKLSAGSYQYGPETGVTATTYTVDRVCAPSSLSKNGVASAASGTDNNEGNGFIIGDDTSAGNNVVTSLAYKVTVEHTQGVVAHDNLGGDSVPVKRIEAGSKSAQTPAYTGFRKYFYGCTNDKPEINSANVRKLTNSNGAYSKQTLTINVTPGTSRVAIACIGTVTGVTKVLNETALNADITGAFVKSTVQIEGANGYAPKAYNIWVFEPAAPFEGKAVLKVTLG